MKLERSQFLKEVKEMFPELREPLNAEEGLPTFEMDVFCQFTQKKINDGEKSIVLKCFEIADRYYRQGNKRFRNIIATSFVEGLDFKNSSKTYREWAWVLFPKALKDEYILFFGKPGR